MTGPGPIVLSILMIAAFLLGIAIWSYCRVYYFMFYVIEKYIDGDYKFIDEFAMTEGFDENAEFFTLTYETPVAVNHNIAFGRIAPLLWMRAGSCGQRIDKVPVA